MSANPVVFPLECRDQLDEAEAYYNNPLRVQNRELKDEVLTLKRLLRENGISWPSSLNLSSESATLANKARKTRSSAGPRDSISQASGLPNLPMEVQLHIMEYALTSDFPILDPLCKLKWEHMSNAEKACSNQIAIGFLATCKAFLVEGTKILWGNNEFVFSSPEALREFSNVEARYRNKITRITLRVVGKYYDDEKRAHSALLSSGRRASKLKVIPRAKQESKLARKGFRSYTWCQVSDFLNALRPPFDPNHNKKLPRPRLLPKLESMRIDLINFPADYLGFPEPEFHQLAFHDLGCTLNELMVTGLPTCDVGQKALSDLSGMIKDDGLLIKCKASFVSSGNQLRSLLDGIVTPKAIRTWKPIAVEWNSQNENSSQASSNGDLLGHHHHDHHHHRNVADLPSMPAVPEEKGHPESIWKNRRTIWKRVPLTRDSKEREWVEFDRTLGEPMSHWSYSEDFDIDDIEELVCSGCGEIHDPLGWEDE